ncbi:MAG: RNA polymerase sigma factor [Thermotogae bacterium]|nr:RNA polymerase sigma factor [Thermotogota bacterium]MCP5465492.1 RNA polymerase sigma factor [Thermotogota bacterium]HOO73972.1 RNA polymerase sigma factor [Tepiditoga sp.]
MKENKLINLLKSKNKEAFEYLYRETSPLVYGILKNYIHTPEIEDAMQEVYVRVFKYIDTFKNESKLMTWMYRIAVNVGKDFIKKNKNNFINFDDAEKKYFNFIQSDENVSENAINQITNEKIDQIMKSMEDDERLIIKLRDIEGMSYSDIASVMDIPEGTVKSKLHYSRKKLQKLIENENIF